MPSNLPAVKAIYEAFGRGDIPALMAYVIEAVPPGGSRDRDEEIHLWTFDAAGKVIGLRHYTGTAKHFAAAQPA